MRYASGDRASISWVKPLTSLKGTLPANAPRSDWRDVSGRPALAAAGTRFAGTVSCKRFDRIVV